MKLFAYYDHDDETGKSQAFQWLSSKVKYRGFRPSVTFRSYTFGQTVRHPVSPISSFDFGYCVLFLYVLRAAMDAIVSRFSFMYLISSVISIVGCNLLNLPVSLFSAFTNDSDPVNSDLLIVSGAFHHENDHAGNVGELDDAKVDLGRAGLRIPVLL